MSCKIKNEDSNKENDAEKIENETINDDSITFLTNQQVEELIALKPTLFMKSFWVGMTKSESIEVIRYLLDKNEVWGQIYSYSNGDLEDLKVSCLKNPAYDQDKIMLFCHLVSKNKTIDCSINLNFNDDPVEPSLENLLLSATSLIELQDFEDVINLYEKKYGRPVETVKNKPKNEIFQLGEIYRKYAFEKENTAVTISYQSEHQVAEGLQSPNQIHILYENIDFRKQETEIMNKKIENIKKEQEQDREKTWNNI